MTRLWEWLARSWGGRIARAAPLLAVLLVAASLRFWGLNWDQGILAHPDERRIMSVVQGLHWPQPWDWSLVLSPRSPLNPHFFSYGSLPLYLLRLAGALVGAPPVRLYLVGRALSAAFDLLTVALLYRIGNELGGRRAGVIAAALLAVAVLPIQLAHFFTVDTLLTLLCTLAVYQAVKVVRAGSLRAGLWGGVYTGLALATKTSALPLLFVNWVAWTIWALRPRVCSGRLSAPHPERVKSAQALAAAGGQSAQTLAANKGWGSEELAADGGAGGTPAEPPRLGWGLLGLALGGVAALLTFLVAEPYSLIDWFRFGQGLLQESAMASGRIDLPYTRQFIGTLPYLYPVQELAIWSLGLPLGLAGLAGLVWLTVRGVCMRQREDVVILAWVWPYFLIVGGLYARFPRYLSPLIPWLCLAAALALGSLDGLVVRERGGHSAHASAPWRCHEDSAIEQNGALRTPSPLLRTGRLPGIVTALVFVPTLLYALAFVSIYGRTHPWIVASRWLTQTAPQGSVLAVEYWGDPLPVAGTPNADGRFHYLWLDPFAPDDAAKLDQLVAGLQQSDYIVLASQRLYGTIGRLGERYPLTSAYYRLLFAEQLGFRLVDVRTNYPRLGPLAIVDEPLAGTPLPKPALLQSVRIAPLVLDLGRADESYAVYDHPRTLIFKKEQALSAAELRALLLQAQKTTGQN